MSHSQFCLGLIVNVGIVQDFETVGLIALLVNDFSF